MRRQIPDTQVTQRLIVRRCLVAALGVLVLAGVLIGRLVYLQVFHYQHYDGLAEENRVRLVAIPPTRGLIYDRNGVLLAENIPSYRLVVTPEQVKDMSELLGRLGTIIELTATDLERFEDLRARQPRFEEIPLKLQLTEAEVARLAVDRHRFLGVEVKADLSRRYPLDETAAHVLGYVGRIDSRDTQLLEARNAIADYRGTSHFGKNGIERYYEELLHGEVGIERVETNAQGRPIRVLARQAPVPGRDLYLTLDIRLQQAAEVALGDRSGAIVALDPSTGEILALVSKPGYDPNAFVNGISIEAYRALQSDRNRPLFNRATRGQYPPGSTVKPFIGLAALEAGTVTVDDKIFCPGFYRIPGNEHRYRGWKSGGHGWQDLIDALAESNDIYFYDVAYRLGIDAMSTFLGRFGFGAETGIDLPGELTGINPSRQWKRTAKGEPWYHGETVITGIGQGFSLATPLQLTQATAVLANRGRYIRPHLLLGTATVGSRPTVEHPVAGPALRLKNPEHWDPVIAGMRRAVHGKRGTARDIGLDLSYQVAGKTGTAQVFTVAQDEEYDAAALAKYLHDHALFIAFAPVDAPRIAVAVIVENGGSGSGTAAPIARRVLDAFFRPAAVARMPESASAAGDGVVAPH